MYISSRSGARAGFIWVWRAAAARLGRAGATVARRRPADAVARARTLVDAVASLQMRRSYKDARHLHLVSRRTRPRRSTLRVAPGEGPVAPSGAEMVIMRWGAGKETKTTAFPTSGRRVVDRLVSYDVLVVDEEEEESESPDGVGAGLECLSLIVPNLDEAFSEGSPAAASSAVAAVVDVAPIDFRTKGPRDGHGPGFAI